MYFTGIGTVVNIALVIAGGLAGLFSGRFIKDRYQETILKILGFGIIVMALSGALSQMMVIDVVKTSGGFSAHINTQGTIMLIVSLSLGAIVGEWIDFDSWFEKFGTWLKQKTGSNGDNLFVDGFVSASLTICVGAMAIVGAINDGILQDPSMLYSKGVIDFFIIMAMAAAMGKGPIFAAIPVFAWQMLITFAATLVMPIMTDLATSNLAMVGNTLIVCVAVNMIWPKTIRVANVLPALIFAVAFAFI